MTGQPVEGTCVEHLHAHVHQCYRRGLADGYAQGVADHEAALRAVEALLREALNESMIGLQGVMAEDRCEVLHREEYARDGHPCIECTEHAADLLHDGWDERIVGAALASAPQAESEAP